MRFYRPDWRSLILLVYFILLGFACRVGAMGSIYLLSDKPPATHDCLESYFYVFFPVSRFVGFSGSFISLGFFRICTLFGVVSL